MDAKSLPNPEQDKEAAFKNWQEEKLKEI